MKSPQSNTCHDTPNACGECEDNICEDQADNAKHETARPACFVSHYTSGIGRQGVNDIHDDQYQWDKGNSQSCALGTKDQKCFGKSCQCQHCRHSNNGPIGQREVSGGRKFQSRSFLLDMPLWFLDRKYHQGKGKKGGNDCDPENQLEVVATAHHQGDGEQRSKKRACGIEGLSQPKTCPAQLGRCNIRNQGIARRTTNALADPVNKPGTNQPVKRLCHREDRLRKGCQPIADHSKQLAFPKPVRQGT